MKYTDTHIHARARLTTLFQTFIRLSILLLSALTGYRWLRLPRLRPLGEEGRGPESCRPVREYSAHRAPCALHKQSQSIGDGQPTHTKAQQLLNKKTTKKIIILIIRKKNKKQTRDTKTTCRTYQKSKRFPLVSSDSFCSVHARPIPLSHTDYVCIHTHIRKYVRMHVQDV